MAKAKIIEVSPKVYKVADIGYGYLKYLNEKGIVQKEKAVIGILGDTLNTGDGEKADVITVDGMSYVVGDAVYEMGRKTITANEHTGRPSNIAYKVLGLYGLAKTYKEGEKITMVTGLPFQNMDESDEVKKLFQDKHEIKFNGQDMTLDIDEVIVVSQGLGSFYSLLRQRGMVALEKKMLLVDLGFHTINLLPINKGGDIDIKMVKTNRDLGIQDAYKRIADGINFEFKANFKFYEVDALLDDGVPTQDVDKGIVHVPINGKPYVIEALREYAQDVWSDIVDKYGDKYREDLNEVVFTGGTAKRVESHLMEVKKHYCSVVEDPQDVQALGYMEIAKKIEKSRESK